MNWEAVAKPNTRWIITKVVFHESQLESKNKSIAGKGSTLSTLIYHWLLILMFDNKTTSISFFFSLVSLSFCWGSPLHHFWLIKKKKGFIFTSRIKKNMCPSSTILCEENEFTNCFSDDFPAWSPALGKCIPLRARNIFFYSRPVHFIFCFTPCNKSLFIQVSLWKLVMPDRKMMQKRQWVCTLCASMECVCVCHCVWLYRNICDYVCICVSVSEGYDFCAFRSRASGWNPRTLRERHLLMDEKLPQCFASCVHKPTESATSQSLHKSLEAALSLFYLCISDNFIW